eukprot:gene7232-8960_t
MSSMHQILGSLQKVTDDKKAQLTAIYEENSRWLQQELAVIRQLIQESSAGQAKGIEESSSKKRKSPETAINPVKLSPEQKRSSVDCDELLAQAGLPSDLNKLKKEQLLEILEQYGDNSGHMKMLKKDMIDRVRLAVMAKARAQQAIAGAEGSCALNATLPKKEAEEPQQEERLVATVQDALAPRTPGPASSAPIEMPMPAPPAPAQKESEATAEATVA